MNRAILAAALLAGCNSPSPAARDAGLQCPGSFSECGAVCADTQRDANNCGACGQACGAGQSCTAGACGCPGATPNACSGFCTSFQTDPNNCGACGTVCGASERCAAGHCATSCPAGSTACPAASPAYCANLQSDPLNCGTCGANCPLQNESCVSGACSCGLSTIAVGRHHACSLRGGKVVCWGILNIGRPAYSGASGDDGDNNKVRGQAFGSYLPFRIPSLESATQLAASGANLCALRTDGTVSCVGGNTFGQLGANLPPGRTAPPSQIGVRVQKVPAVLGDGGLATPEDLTGVTVVAGSADWPKRDGGGPFFCAINPDGVWCWGSNATEQLAGGASIPGAEQVLGLPESPAVQLALGNTMGCALTAAGEVWCWGNGGGCSGPPERIDGLGTVARLAAGAQHVCAIDTSGVARCFGTNLYGELGDGTTNDTNTPVEVMAPTGVTLADGGVELQPLTGITRIAPSANFTCLVAGAQVYCWGRNDEGQAGTPPVVLPDGGIPPVPLPAQIGLSGAVDVAEGYASGCATKTDGTVWCWGRNSRGTLGTGSAGDSALPVQVAGCE